MKSITTKTNKYGWNYTFKERNDGTIIIIQKNNKNKMHREIHIFDDELNIFHDFIKQLKQ